MQNYGKILHFVTRVVLDDFAWLYCITRKFFLNTGLQVDTSSQNKEHKNPVSILRTQV